MAGLAELVEGVGGAGEFCGELHAVGQGFVLIEHDAAEGGKGGLERGGVGGQPALFFQVGGVFDGSAVGFLRAGDDGALVLRLIDADLELAAELHIVTWEGLTCGAAGGGSEALDLGKGGGLLGGEVAGVAGFAALLLDLGAHGGKGGLQEGAEDDGWGGRGVIEPCGHGGGVFEVTEGVIETVSSMEERGQWEGELAFVAHGQLRA